GIDLVEGSLGERKHLHGNDVTAAARLDPSCGVCEIDALAGIARLGPRLASARVISARAGLAPATSSTAPAGPASPRPRPRRARARAARGRRPRQRPLPHRSWPGANLASFRRAL